MFQLLRKFGSENKKKSSTLKKNEPNKKSDDLKIEKKSKLSVKTDNAKDFRRRN